MGYKKIAWTDPRCTPTASGRPYVYNGITPTLSAGAHARCHRHISICPELWGGSNSNKRYLVQYVSIFPCGWCKVMIFSWTKRNLIPVCKFFNLWQELSKLCTYFAAASVRRYHSGAPRHPRIRRNLCAHPLHLLVSSYVRLAYAEMRLAIEDEGTVHTRTGSQVWRAQEYLGQVNFSNPSN